MRKSCLPCHLIVRNVCLVLLSLAGTLLVITDIHATANAKTQQAQALRRLFVMQLVLNYDDDR